jgi:hypothetical protein
VDRYSVHPEKPKKSFPGPEDLKDRKRKTPLDPGFKINREANPNFFDYD